MSVLNFLQAAVSQTQQQLIYGEVCPDKPVPTSFYDPLYICLPDWTTDYYFTIDPGDWEASHGSALPEANAPVFLARDGRGGLRCIWWHGNYVAPSATRPLAIGMNDVEGWGPTVAATIRNGGVRWGRVGPPPLDSGDPAAALSEGFRMLLGVGNIANGTLLTTLNPATQAALALTQVQTYPGVSVLECINEPWLKGSQAWPVMYGQIYMATLNVLRNAGITLPLLYSATGDFFAESSTSTWTLTNTSAVVTGVSTDAITAGQNITVTTGIPANTWVGSVDSSTQFTLNQPANASGSQSLTFASRFSSVDDADSGWVGRACKTVPGLAAAIQENGVTLHPYGMPTEDGNGHSSGIASVTYDIAAWANSPGITPDVWISEFGYLIDGITSGATTGVKVLDESEQVLRIGQALDALVAIPAVKGIFQYQSHDLGWGCFNSPPSDPGSTRRSFSAITSRAKQHPDPI